MPSRSRAALKALRQSLEALEEEMNGFLAPVGFPCRPPDGDDYNRLHDHIQDALADAGLRLAAPRFGA